MGVLLQRVSALASLLCVCAVFTEGMSCICGVVSAGRVQAWYTPHCLRGPYESHVASCAPAPVPVYTAAGPELWPLIVIGGRSCARAKPKQAAHRQKVRRPCQRNIFQECPGPVDNRSEGAEEHTVVVHFCLTHSGAGQRLVARQCQACNCTTTRSSRCRLEKLTWRTLPCLFNHCT